jgi:hypothetical protein
MDVNDAFKSGRCETALSRAPFGAPRGTTARRPARPGAGSEGEGRGSGRAESAGAPARARGTRLGATSPPSSPRSRAARAPGRGVASLGSSNTSRVTGETSGVREEGVRVAPCAPWPPCASRPPGSPPRILVTWCPTSSSTFARRGWRALVSRALRSVAVTDSGSQTGAGGSCRCSAALSAAARTPSQEALGRNPVERQTVVSGFRPGISRVILLGHARRKGGRSVSALGGPPPRPSRPPGSSARAPRWRTSRATPRVDAPGRSRRGRRRVGRRFGRSTSGVRAPRRGVRFSPRRFASVSRARGDSPPPPRARPRGTRGATGWGRCPTATSSARCVA